MSDSEGGLGHGLPRFEAEDELEEGFAIVMGDGDPTISAIVRGSAGGRLARVLNGEEAGRLFLIEDAGGSVGSPDRLDEGEDEDEERSEAGEPVDYADVAARLRERHGLDGEDAGAEPDDDKPFAIYLDGERIGLASQALGDYVDMLFRPTLRPNGTLA